MHTTQVARTGGPEDGAARRRATASSNEAQVDQRVVGAARGQRLSRVGDVLALQRALGNQAVQRLLQRTNGPTAAMIQRAAKLIDGLDVDKPSTYDTGGGHSYADHGAHTTEEQQRNRLKTGKAPSGRSSPVPTGAGASKFASDAKHVEGMKAAAAELKSKNQGKKKLKGITGPMPLDGAGPVYFRDGTSVTGTNVTVDLMKVTGSDDTFRLNTMFPMP